MTEATYNHFAAHLGNTTAEVEARLRRWASGCEEYILVEPRTALSDRSLPRRLHLVAGTVHRL